MSEARSYAVPAGMLKAAVKAVKDRSEFGFVFLDNKDEERIVAQTMDTLKAALRWQSENPLEPEALTSQKQPAQDDDMSAVVREMLKVYMAAGDARKTMYAAAVVARRGYVPLSAVLAVIDGCIHKITFDEQVTALKWVRSELSKLATPLKPVDPAVNAVQDIIGRRIDIDLTRNESIAQSIVAAVRKADSVDSRCGVRSWTYTSATKRGNHK